MKRDMTEDFILLEIFKGRCPKCREMAYTIHELEPRARGSTSMRRMNRTPICVRCHNDYHSKGASEKNVNEWKAIIKEYLTIIGTWDLYNVDDNSEGTQHLRKLL